MNSPSRPNPHDPSRPLNEQALDLLIASQTDTLSPEQTAQLEAALREADDREITSTLRAIDAARLALRGDEAGADDLAPALASRLTHQAAGYFAAAQRREPAPAGPFPFWQRSAGWFVAAAAIVLAAIAWSYRPATPVPPASVTAALDARADTQRWPFAGKTEDAKNVTGEVVWNEALQQGYMVLTGLAPNDPVKSQYQLWIVDPSRAEQPVDGGVFDAPRPGERVVFTPRLPVRSPAAFAITAEKPGGVVVSKGPLLVVAARQ